MNARMYAVTPAVEAGWRALLGHVTQDARVPLTYVPYPAPQPLEQLWARGDLGSVLMCGDRKSTRLNSSHSQISYAVFCLKKKKTTPLSAEPTVVRSSAARSAQPYTGTSDSVCRI